MKSIHFVLAIAFVACACAPTKSVDLQTMESKISKGMTQDQVRAKIGEPTFISGHQDRKVYWTYNQSHGLLEVNFEQGKCTFKRVVIYNSK